MALLSIVKQMGLAPVRGARCVVGHALRSQCTHAPDQHARRSLATVSSCQPPPPPPATSSASASAPGAIRRRQLAVDLAPPQVPLSAEEAVDNILYNHAMEPMSSRTAKTGPAVKRHVLNCLVTNESGVLARISGSLAGRGFNIESLGGF
jgi:acetolactate synthase I/III small subunit